MPNGLITTRLWSLITLFLVLNLSWLSINKVKSFQLQVCKSPIFASKLHLYDTTSYHLYSCELHSDYCKCRYPSIGPRDGWKVTKVLYFEVNHLCSPFWIYDHVPSTMFILFLINHYLILLFILILSFVFIFVIKFRSSTHSILLALDIEDGCRQ